MSRHSPSFFGFFLSRTRLGTGILLAVLARLSILSHSVIGDLELDKINTLRLIKDFLLSKSAGAQDFHKEGDIKGERLGGNVEN